MKKIVLFLAVVALSFSCSNDAEDNDGANSISSLVGTWNLIDARFEQDPNDSSLNFADEVLDVLAAQNCFLVTFTFNSDGSGSTEDKINFLLQNAGPDGLSVDCPDQSELETFTWSLEGNQLTLNDQNQASRTIRIVFENDNTLIISGEDIDAANYAGAEAVFTRQ